MDEKEAQQVSLSNLCGGAIEEVFQREFASVLQNIADVNTDAEAKRKITLEFTIAPFEDRSGAQVTFACKSKTVPVEAVKGTVFLQRRGLVMVAVPHDPKQIRMFDGKKAAANDVQ
ncbi:MAG: hypothetical protein ACRD4V_07680 [Candidatus Acidiferrales bacterium]